MTNEERFELIKKALTQLDGVEAHLRQALNGKTQYEIGYLMKACEVHIADLRCDIDGILCDM